ncbi:MAG TPA: hypothetical protein VGC54_05055 [Planctomycetota bacterium]
MSGTAGAGGGWRLLTGLLPYLVSAFVPALTPARALLCGWLLELGVPAGSGKQALASFALRHGSAWLLLHQLRPDAALLFGMVFLAAALLSLPWWSCADWRRGPALRTAIALALLLPGALGLLAQLAGRDPAPIHAADPWQWAAAPAATSEFDAEQAYRTGAPIARPEPAALPLRLPVRMRPAPLEDAPERGRALLLVCALLGLQAAAVTLGRRRVVQVLLPTVFFPWAGALLAGGHAGMQVEYRSDPAGTGAVWRLEIHAEGIDLWDPLRGAFLPPVRPFVLRREEQNGLQRVVSQSPWAVVRESAEALAGFAEPAAWLEVHPLRAPRWGGPAAGTGGLGILHLWAAGESREGGGARWELAANGRDLRRLPLP